MGGILTRLFAAAVTSPPPPDSDYWYGPVEAPSASGVSVTPDSALRVGAVFACVRLLANTIGSLPLFVYRRLDRGKEKAADLPLYEVLHSRPNDWQTAFDFRSMMEGHLALRGNAYAQIVAGRRGAVDQLLPLHPDRVDVFRLTNGRLGYEAAQPDGTRKRLTQDEVFHLRGFSLDGISGLSPISLAREMLGSQLAAQTYGGSFFRNNARPGGALKTPNKLSQPARDNLKRSWSEQHAGPYNAGRVAILEENLDWVNIGMSNEDAQWLDFMQFGPGQIAMLFGVPPHMIGDVSRSTSWGSGIEEQGIGFVTYTLASWFALWEQACDRDLITDTETYFTRFNAAALLRGDTGRRYSAYAIGRQGGWLSVNDIRELEDMNPVEGGDEYMVPLNMAPAGAPPPAPDEETDGDEEGEDEEGLAAGAPPAGPPSDRRALDVLLADAAERCARAELRELEKRADKAAADMPRWRAWLFAFYEGHATYLRKCLGPVADAWALQSGRVVDCMALAGSVVNDAAARLLDDPAPVVAGWQGTRAGELAARFRAEFEEDKHPRDDGGKFAPSDGGGGPKEDESDKGPEGPGGDRPPPGGFRDSEAANAWAETHVRTEGGLKAEESRALDHYKGDGHKEMNAALRGGRDTTDPKAADAIRRMDEAISRSRVDQESAVTRGLAFEGAAEFFRAKVGQTYLDRAFVSTTLDAKTSARFTRGGRGDKVHAEITVPRDTPCVYRQGFRESELILGRGCVFRVDGVEEESRRGVGKITRVRMTLVRTGVTFGHTPRGPSGRSGARVRAQSGGVSDLDRFHWSEEDLEEYDEEGEEDRLARTARPRYRAGGGFEEDRHPRDEGGKFAPSEGGGGDKGGGGGGGGGSGSSGGGGKSLKEAPAHKDYQAAREKADGLRREADAKKREAEKAAPGVPYVRAHEAATDALLAANKARGEAAGHARRAFQETHALPAGQAARPKFEEFGRFSKATRAEVNQAGEFLGGVLGKDAHEGQTDVGLQNAKGRSSYGFGAIYVTKDADAGTVAHEFGHHLEQQEWVQERVGEFMQKRFGGEEPTKLAERFPKHGFGAEETGRKDDLEKLFPDKPERAYYVGKTYAGRKDTEVLSMGAELLYRDPVHFEETDPEYFHLVVGILKGEGRRKKS